MKKIALLLIAAIGLAQTPDIHELTKDEAAKGRALYAQVNAYHRDADKKTYDEWAAAMGLKYLKDSHVTPEFSSRFEYVRPKHK